MIKHIVLTGGICSGKTTALPLVRAYLESKDIKVYTVPEIATILFTNGFERPVPQCKLEFQMNMLRTQLALEDGFRSIVWRETRPTVVLYDRGAMDGEAFTDPCMWSEILEYLELPEYELIQRYDMVIHLVTTAIGAESFYTLQNNTARKETLEEARENDKLIRDAWSEHSNVKIIDNSTDFKGKVDRIIKIIDGELNA